jgi:hypothetical protein
MANHNPKEHDVRDDDGRRYIRSPYDVGDYASRYDDRNIPPNDQRAAFPLRQQSEPKRRDFRGKGPHSYKRSDKRILDDVNDRLYLDYYIDASGIEVEVDEGTIILNGMVDNLDAKRRAEDIAETVSGVKNVENRLRVAPINEHIVGPVRSVTRESLM